MRKKEYIYIGVLLFTWCSFFSCYSYVLRKRERVSQLVSDISCMCRLYLICVLDIFLFSSSFTYSNQLCACKCINVYTVWFFFFHCIWVIHISNDIANNNNNTSRESLHELSRIFVLFFDFRFKKSFTCILV